jgi:hypothetical protein
MSNTFKCAVCEETFEKGWSDEKAEAELRENFNVPVEDCAIVCDGCYKKMGFG